MVVQLALNSIVLGSLIALVSIGFTLIFGILRIINFWHGEAYMLGAVGTFYLLTHAGINYWLSGVIAVLAMVLFGWVANRLVFQRFYGNLIGGVIVGAAISLGIQNVMWYIIGTRARVIPSVVTGKLNFLGASITAEQFLIILVAAGTIMGLTWFIGRTKLGKAMRAVQQDSEAARTVGISTERICGITFGIATGLAALAGFLVAPIYSITPVMGIDPLMYAFLTVILGGMGSVAGTLVASFIIGFQQSFTSAFIGPEFAIGISFSIVMLILIFRPKGLFGHD